MDFQKKSRNNAAIVLSQKQKSENFHQEFLKNAAKEVNLNKILASHSDKIATMEGLITGQILNQQDIILKRLEERKNKFNRPKSLPPSTRNTEENETHTPVFAKSSKKLFCFFTKEKIVFFFQRKNRVFFLQIRFLQMKKLFF